MSAIGGTTVILFVGDAAARLQLSLPRAEARGHRRFSGLHPAGVEDTPKSTKNICAQCKLTNNVNTHTHTHTHTLKQTHTHLNKHTHTHN